jgi:hypothetical protein
MDHSHVERIRLSKGPNQTDNSTGAAENQTSHDVANPVRKDHSHRKGFPRFQHYRNPPTIPLRQAKPKPTR